MISKYYQDNKLNCTSDNSLFISYLSDLKTLFEKAKNLEESSNLNESKNLLLNHFGQFIPRGYHTRKNTSSYFDGIYAEKTTEIINRYNDIYNSLSDEDINFLTGNNVEVTKNRIKLFLVQQLRDIDSLLT